jgi:hypothetical protein
VRIAVLKDAHVVVAVAAVEGRQPLEQASEAIGALEVTDRR